MDRKSCPGIYWEARTVFIRGERNVVSLGCVFDNLTICVILSKGEVPVMLERNITNALLAALGDTPVVLLQGPRQSGKSTLVGLLAEKKRRAAYFTMDDAAVLAAATRDPDAFIHAITGPVVIDEVQLVPDLFRAIKLEVDRRRTPGRFLLTGSANVLLVPKVSESLAGRMEILTLWPFSVGELAGVREGFIDRVFGREKADVWPIREGSRSDLVKRMLIGGYPEVTQRTNAERRRAWFASYITTILQRDVRAMADIEGLAVLPRMLSMLAAQSGGLLNTAELARDAGFSVPTAKRYLTLLQATHLYQPLYAWSGNVRKRLIKSPKVYLNDTGLLSYLMGWSVDSWAEPSAHLGRLLEAFVCQELRKQITWSQTKPTLYYYRTAGGREVDFVLEDQGGRIVGIEVKAAVKLSGDDLKGLEDLSATVGKRFHAGVLLYQGSGVVPVGPKCWAVPLASMFEE